MSEAMASPQLQRGPVGNTRSIGLSILWAILTLGIYTFVWTYKTQEEIRRYSGWFVKVQGALNRYWESKGAPPP